MTDKELLPIVRVMRLYKPNTSVESTNPMGLEDASGSAMNAGISRMLTLPESFGEIFVGETFAAYVAVVNNSGTVFENVQLQVRLQTEQAVHDLVDVRGASSPTESAVLQAGNGRVDMIVKHMLSEAATYNMRVTFNYTDPFHPGVPKVVRKFYRFEASKPFGYSCTAVSDGPGPGSFTVYGRLSNSTSRLVNVAEITFEPLPELTSTLSTNLVTRPSTALVNPDGSINPKALYSAPLLAPDESYAFCFAGKMTTELPHGSILGSVLIKWVSRMGESSYFNTAPVAIGKKLYLRNRESGGVQLVTVDCISAPRHVKLDEPFTVQLEVMYLGSAGAPPVDIRMWSDASMEQRPSSLRVVNESHIELSQCRPGERRRVPLTLKSLVQGLVALNSLHTSVNNSVVQHVDTIAQVLSS